MDSVIPQEGDHRVWVAGLDPEFRDKVVSLLDDDAEPRWLVKVYPNVNRATDVLVFFRFLSVINVNFGDKWKEGNRES